MSYTADDPASCPLCLCDCGLPHLADRPILVAWRAGRESYEVPSANGESTYAANPYADGSIESWAWGQGRQSVARLDRKSSPGTGRAVTDIYGGLDPRDIPLYTPAEATAILGFEATASHGLTFRELASIYVEASPRPVATYRIVFDDNGDPTRIYPHRVSIYEPLTVSVDARKAFGQPTVADRNLLVSTVVDLHEAGETVEAIAAHHDLSPEVVRAVIAWSRVGCRR